MTPDIVITVCASAAGETCPAYLGPVLRSHWGVDDPAPATGHRRRDRCRVRCGLLDPARAHRSLHRAAARCTEARPRPPQARARSDRQSAALNSPPDRRLPQ
ncbi:MAG: hypothetical protein MZU91_12700 [Desulfosudis oleivorans]|nr:hypothetical protein [Desulfosudis oleivorans]